MHAEFLQSLATYYYTTVKELPYSKQQAADMLKIAVSYECASLLAYLLQFNYESCDSEFDLLIELTFNSCS